MDRFVRGLKDALQIVALTLGIALMVWGLFAAKTLGEAAQRANLPRPVTHGPCVDGWSQSTDGTIERC